MTSEFSSLKNARNLSESESGFGKAFQKPRFQQAIQPDTNKRRHGAASSRRRPARSHRSNEAGRSESDQCNRSLQQHEAERREIGNCPFKIESRGNSTLNLFL